ncbi:MAG: dTDP-4-dehydrorhamnose 3,5-epimerase [Trueperaceae bacterium]|nr:dTDP-4-dehydrorhamnose 3,5-epimerase [Trueperaceae bacterium]
MLFKETPLGGAFVIDLEEHRDDRGSFARTFCRREFEAHGLETAVVQTNLSVSQRAGTVRGMHYQVHPATETKYVRCTRGAIYDVIIDLRPDSPTYAQHFGVELSASNRRGLFVPRMFAHGFQTLEDESEVTYIVSEFHAPSAERGVRHDDPAFEISWPKAVTVISDKDAAWPVFAP